MANCLDEDSKIIVVRQFINYAHKAIFHAFIRISKKYWDLMDDEKLYGDLENEINIFGPNSDILSPINNLSSLDMDILFDSLYLLDILKTLSDTERKIIFLKYYLDLTDEDIAKKLDFTRVYVCRVKNKALEKLKIILSNTENKKLL